MFKSKKRKELENRVAVLESTLDHMAGVLNTLTEVSAAATTDNIVDGEKLKETLEKYLDDTLERKFTRRRF
ncbi:hypothetical protein SAMN05421503_2471 [Terribacillus aidingensis]|uniref:Uncharacterized protein n=1 Tax=Terribacillus aidingensis TaxID=586416 RepID=A0A285NYM2_9BACI|nr:hypothetical protein [Terribacillus aidingensis]SNZ14549.1 hypothetical protein SAMN05421503_2471 [Terribacillus aidingensis]